MPVYAPGALLYNELNRHPELGRGLFRNVVTPLTILGSTNLLAWWRSDLGITLNGSDVQQWDDQTGNGHHLIQLTAGNQPAYGAATGPNGRPGLTFVAASNERMVDSTLDLDPPGTNPTFFWWIASPTTWGANRRLFSSGAVANRLMLYQRTATPSVSQNNTSDANSIAWTLGAFARLEVYFSNSVSDYIKIAGTTVTGANAGNGDPAAGFRLCSDHVGSNCISAVVSEGFVYRGTPTAAQLTQLDAYATGLYGAGLV